MKNLLIISKQILLIFLLISTSEICFAQEIKQFTTIKEVLKLAKSKNLIFKNADYQNQIAELSRKTAIGNVFNPKIPTNVQTINNIKQQISFLPGSVFGLPEGTYKQVEFGQQYVSSFSIQPQFDLINLSNYAQIKTAEITKQLVENQNKINAQNLYENINIVYFNILSYNAQKEILLENITIAEEILRIIQNKFNEGISRKQEVNEAEVNLISLQDKLEQLETNTKIQYQTLNLFFENEIDIILSESVWNFEDSPYNLQTKNNLAAENASIKAQIAQQEYKSLQYQNLPVLSFISSFNWQNLSNDNFFAQNSDWINFNYVGLKLSYDLPTTLQKYSNIQNKKIQLEIFKNNEIHSRKENESINKKMVLQYEKAINQLENFQRIYALKKDTYDKNYNQFKENILPLDKLLISQNDMLISKINVIMALSTIGYNKTKIEINNGL